MSISYWIKRKKVKIRGKKRIVEYELAMKDLHSEEVELFNKVCDIAKNNRHLIRFDPQDSEILIVLEHMLVILKNQTINIQNTNGFVMLKLPSAAFDFAQRLLSMVVNFLKLHPWKSCAIPPPMPMLFPTGFLIPLLVRLSIQGCKAHTYKRGSTVLLVRISSDCCL